MNDHLPEATFEKNTNRAASRRNLRELRRTSNSLEIHEKCHREFGYIAEYRAAFELKIPLYIQRRGQRARTKMKDLTDHERMERARLKRVRKFAGRRCP